MRQIAVNIADLTRYDQLVCSLMIAPLVQDRRTCDPAPERIDGDCVILACAEERARAVVSFLRDVDKRDRQYAVRAYASGPRGGWKRI